MPYIDALLQTRFHAHARYGTFLTAAQQDATRRYLQTVGRDAHERDTLPVPAANSTCGQIRFKPGD